MVADRDFFKLLIDMIMEDKLNKLWNFFFEFCFETFLWDLLWNFVRFTVKLFGRYVKLFRYITAKCSYIKTFYLILLLWYRISFVNLSLYNIFHEKYCLFKGWLDFLYQWWIFFYDVHKVKEVFWCIFSCCLWRV